MPRPIAWLVRFPGGADRATLPIMGSSHKIILLAIILGVAGCGGSVSVNDKGQVAVGEKTLDVAALPFTFRYPGAFQEATDASVEATHSVAVVGIPGEDSYIAVHHNGSVPMTLDALEAQARTALGAGVTRTGRVRHGAIEMVSVTTGVAGEGDVSSTMNGFPAAGGTWLIECRSNAANRARMAEWCSRALDSLKLRR